MGNDCIFTLPHIPYDISAELKQYYLDTFQISFKQSTGLQSHINIKCDIYLKIVLITFSLLYQSLTCHFSPKTNLNIHWVVLKSLQIISLLPEMNTVEAWQEDRKKRLRFQYLFVCFIILEWMPLLCWKRWNPFQRTCHHWISWVSGCLENKPSTFPSILLITCLSVDWKIFWVMCIFMCFSSD